MRTHTRARIQYAYTNIMNICNYALCVYCTVVVNLHYTCRAEIPSAFRYIHI